MARIARLVVPGSPHHVTQRGNRRERTFFEEADYRLYRDLLAEASAKADTEIWAYCLMPNHVHLILVPQSADGLRRSLADLHRRYTTNINARHGWTGHLWQGRFGSVAMDEDHLIAAARHVSLNPVRARLVSRAQDWPWSSVRAHLAGGDDGVVKTAPLLHRIGDFAAFLDASVDEAAAFGPLRRAEKTGRPVGGEAWIRQLEREARRPLAPRRRGPKPRDHSAASQPGLYSKLSL
jgi:putative transposase